MGLTSTAARLLTTNHPPSKIDTASIKQSIILIDSRIQKLQRDTDQHHIYNPSVEIMQHLSVDQTQVPIAQLVHLSVSAWSNTGDYLDMLRYFPNLECSRSTKLPHAMQKSARLELANAEHLISLLLFVNAPNLEELVLTSGSGGDWHDEETLAVDMGIEQELPFFITESRCQLRRLELDGVRLGRADFVALLESLRSLRGLKVTTSPFHMQNYFDGATLVRLLELRKSKDGGTTPQLQVLEVCVPSSAVTRKAFAEYVRMHGRILHAKLEYVNEDQEWQEEEDVEKGVMSDSHED